MKYSSVSFQKYLFYTICIFFLQKVDIYGKWEVKMYFWRGRANLVIEIGLS